MATAFNDGSAAASSCSARIGEGTGGPAGTKAPGAGAGAPWNAACPPACERAAAGTVEVEPGAGEVDGAAELATLAACSCVVRAESRFAPSPTDEPIARAGGRAGSFGPVVPRIERGAAGITGGRWEETGAKTAGAIPVWPWVAPGPFSASEAVEAAVARRRSVDEDAR